MAKTIFNLGKISFSSPSFRKINQVIVEMELKEDDQGRLVASFSGGIYNATKKDFLACGQIKDTISEYFSPESGLWGILQELWTKYHLNNLHVGTEKQEDFLELWKIKNNADSLDYETSCRLLEKAGLLVDDGYKYGSGWLYKEITKEDLYLIYTLQKFY